MRGGGEARHGPCLLALMASRLSERASHPARGVVSASRTSAPHRSPKPTNPACQGANRFRSCIDRCPKATRCPPRAPPRGRPAARRRRAIIRASHQTWVAERLEHLLRTPICRGHTSLAEAGRSSFASFATESHTSATAKSQLRTGLGNVPAPRPPAGPEPGTGSVSTIVLRETLAGTLPLRAGRRHPGRRPVCNSLSGRSEVSHAHGDRCPEPGRPQSAYASSRSDHGGREGSDWRLMYADSDRSNRLQSSSDQGTCGGGGLVGRRSVITTHAANPAKLDTITVAASAMSSGDLVPIVAASPPAAANAIRNSATGASACRRLSLLVPGVGESSDGTAMTTSTRVTTG